MLFMSSALRLLVYTACRRAARSVSATLLPPSVSVQVVSTDSSSDVNLSAR